jgi:hypothetical protein
VPGTVAPSSVGAVPGAPPSQLWRPFQPPPYQNGAPPHGDARDGAPATDDAALKSEHSPADEAIKSEPFSAVLSQAEPPAMGSAMGANGFGAPPPPQPYRYPTAAQHDAQQPYRYPTAAQHDAQQPYRYPEAPTGNKMAPMPPVLQAPGTVLDLGSACGAPPSCGEL